VAAISSRSGLPPRSWRWRWVSPHAGSSGPFQRAVLVWAAMLTDNVSNYTYAVFGATFNDLFLVLRPWIVIFGVVS
jgi:hypothetical protein